MNLKILKVAALVRGTRSLLSEQKVFGVYVSALAHVGCYSLYLLSKLIVTIKSYLEPGSPTHPYLNLLSVFSFLVMGKLHKCEQEMRRGMFVAAAAVKKIKSLVLLKIWQLYNQ